MKYLISIILLLSLTLQAEEKPAEKTKIGEIIDDSTKSIGDFVNKAHEPVKEQVDMSPRVREKNNMAILIHYAPMDIIIPSKTGATFSYSGDDRNAQYEIQYLRASFSVPFLVDDLGSITEQRLALIKRNFTKDSNFNWYYGISYHSLEVHLGNEYLSALAPSSQQIPNIDVLKIEALGFDLGLGHRWYFENGITFGIDWIGWSQPLISLKKQNYFSDVATNQEDKDNAEKLMTAGTYLPRFSVLKLSLGYSF